MKDLFDLALQISAVLGVFVFLGLVMEIDHKVKVVTRGNNVKRD